MIETVAGLTDLQIKFLTALGQIVMGLALGTITAVIAAKQLSTARLQAKTARNKLRLDNYQRRVDLYETIDRLARSALGGTSGSHLDLEIGAKITEARWLFGPGVSEYISKKIHDPLIEFGAASVTHSQLLNSRPLEDQEQQELDKTVEDRTRLRREIYDNLRELEKRMDEFLVLEQ
ncbi:hypothetical protein ABIA68_001292 [Stenotrophomonas rhizophila]|jgi:hypothetical protein|uniref:hypothetical protein n=1 Tax=Stenotrophomonas rhizophila TaxID=216778 RepID=UPI0033959E24